MKHTILHAFSNIYSLNKNRFLGATKDIRSRTQYFEDRNRVFEECMVPFGQKNNFAAGLSRLPDEIWKRCRFVILEMTYSSPAIGIIRKRAPDAIVMVRSHNAELFHRLHWACAQKMSKLAVRSIAQSLKNTLMDLIAGVRADYILSISQWEIDHYWRYFVPRRKIKYVPFFLPCRYASDLKPPHAKDDLCIHFGASVHNPLINDASNNFVRLVNAIDNRLPNWKFSITGDMNPELTFQNERIQYLGNLKQPYVILKKAKATAILSNLGYGFKTKILEAVLAKNYIIVPHSLFRRIPFELKPYCLPVDIGSSESFVGALEKCEAEYPPGDPNAELRETAFRTLDELLLADFPDDNLSPH